MCGIFCSLGSIRPLLPNDEIRRRLVNRGPDSINTTEIICPHTTARQQDASPRDIHVTLCSTVLSLRGSVTVTQPYQDPDGKYTLCWNGEAWSIGGEPTRGNDTRAIHRLLVDALDSTSTVGHSHPEPLGSARVVAAALSQVAGPYAFVLFDHVHRRLFFGRDFLGRRSLLKQVTHDGDLIISSITDGDPANGWTEIEAVGVYCIDLRNIGYVAPFRGPEVPVGSQVRQLGQFIPALVPYNFIDSKKHESDALKSVIPSLSLNKELPSNPPPLDEQSEAVACFENVLRDSLRLRVLDIPEPPPAVVDAYAPDRAKLAILFSGGLDCTVLARMSHDLVPEDEPIDLLNVAFENPRIHRNSGAGADHDAYELCPDRITGRASFDELKSTCPGRQWRFVAINVAYAETIEHRQEVISLMHPHNTEMDLSISLALYFAARGTGHISTAEGEELPYATSARVLLSGLGADELFGGYTRHANAFRRSGFQGLLEELELDVRRLGQRNLGRDDRVMVHWSKEVRFPYLDENLLSWALNASVTSKCGFGEPQGDTLTVDGNGSTMLEPEKKVLRCLAWKLGMQGVAKEKKRAIQFGARTAKMETRKTKGTQLLS